MSAGTWSLYLDPRNRAVVTAGPPGSDFLNTQDLVEFDTDSETFRVEYQESWAEAQASGQDLSVAEDGTTTIVPHLPTASDLKVARLRNFLNHPNPQLGDVISILKDQLGG
jgi:hypothetical protein